MRVISSRLVEYNFKVNGEFVTGEHIFDLSCHFTLQKVDEHREFQVTIDYDVDAHNGASCSIRISKIWLLSFAGKVSIDEGLYKVVEDTYQDLKDMTQSLAISQNIDSLPAVPPLEKDTIIRELATKFRDRDY
jgi:hypothetical protein